MSSLTISFYLIIFVNIKGLYQKLGSSARHKITLLVLHFSSSKVQRRLAMFVETR